MPGSIKVVESATGSMHKKKPSLPPNMNIEFDDTMNPLVGSARGSFRGSFRGIPQSNSAVDREDQLKTSGGAHDSDSDDGDDGGMGFQIPVQALDAPTVTVGEL